MLKLSLVLIPPKILPTSIIVPYPGSKIMSASEYFEYVKSGSGEDKYISSKALMGILTRLSVWLKYGRCNNGLD